MRRISRLSALLFLTLLTMPVSASAFLLDIAAGAKGGMNGSLVSAPPEGDTFTIDGNEYFIPQGPEFYGMFGLGGGFGGFLELRALDIVGIETGLHFSYDNGTGWEDKNAVDGTNIGRVYQEQRTTSLRIPVMAKASVPGFVRPTFGLGIEIVNQKKSELKYTADVFDVSSYNTRYTITPSTYTTLAFSFALEIDLGPIRIPIELRGNYNTAFRKDLDERVEASGNPSFPNFEYDGKYQGHFALYTGILYSYDLIF